jgi:hypothetical protein
MTADRTHNMTTKTIVDEIVGLCNVLVCRHIINNVPAPEWFTKELAKVDFIINTVQSAIDAPEDEDVSFADYKPEGGGV